MTAATLAPSKVSRRLSEGISSEVLEHIYRPRLRAEFADVFPVLSQVNQAHLVMLARRAILSPNVAHRIAVALLRMEADGPGAIDPDPSLEDAYFNVEARLIELTDADTGGRLHIGRSRNDLSAAQDRMRVRAALLDMIDEADELRGILLERAAGFADVIVPGYTHLQPAQPITFGFYLTGLASALERDVGRLMDAWPRLNISPMGAAALATTTFPIDRALVADLLGFDGVLDHGLDCVASRDFSIEVLAGAASLALTLSRFGQDMHVAVSQEFSSVEFPDSVCGTSSIMPQKKNPVLLEHLKGKAAHVAAALASAHSCIRASYFTNSIDAHREGQTQMWPALAEARTAIVLARIAASTVEPNRALGLSRARSNHSTATDLADLLVREGSTDFRTAHHIAGAVVRALMDRGLGAHEATLELVDQAALDQSGRRTGVTAEALAGALDPERSVASRTVPGGTAPAEVRRMAAAMLQRLATDRNRVMTWRSSLADAEARLHEAMVALAGPPSDAGSPRP